MSKKEEDFSILLKQPNVAKGPPAWLEFMRLLTTVLASIAIPLVVFFVGENIKGSVKNKELEAKYVEISVEILKEAPRQETESLRSWAIENINKYAEIKLSEEAKKELTEEALPASSVISESKVGHFTVPSTPRDIEYVILTDTENSSIERELEIFRSERVKASYHYIVGVEGRVEKLVDEDNIAWHAGKSEWDGKKNLNRITIGIGITHLSTPNGKNWMQLPADHPAVGPSYPDAQLNALVELLADILVRNQLTVDAILTKQDIAPKRRRSDLHGAPLAEIRMRVAELIKLRSGV